MKTKCPHCGGAINPAALLAAMGKGGRKNYSAVERKRRATRMAEARKARWPKPDARTPNAKRSDASDAFAAAPGSGVRPESRENLNEYGSK